MNKAVTLKAIVAAIASLLSSPFLIAEDILRWGDFEEAVEVSTDADRQRFQVEGWEFGNEPPRIPSGWILHHAQKGKLTIVQDDAKSGNVACKVEGGGWIHAPFPARADSRVNISFQAKGEGKVRVMIFQYEHDSSGSVIQFLDTAELETVQLKEEWTEYKMQHHFSVPAVNQAHIAFDVQGMAVLDSVIIEQAPE